MKQGSAVRLSQEDEEWIQNVIDASENTTTRTELVRAGIRLLREYVKENKHLPPLRLEGLDNNERRSAS